MLTNNDLKQIRIVVRDEVKNEVATQLKDGLEPIKKDLRVVKKDISYLRKTVDIIAKNYDEGDVKFERRVGKIEKHLSLPAGN